MADRDIERVLVTQDEIRARVHGLAEEIAASYTGKDVTLVGVLTGAFIFLADLVRELPLRTKVVFVRARSYGAGSRPGELLVEILGRPELSGRDLLVVEDIVDTGRSLVGIKKALEKRAPRSIRTVVLLDKEERREVDCEVDFTGFVVPDEFLVGYGLDYADRYRHLPYVGILSRSAYSGEA